MFKGNYFTATIVRGGILADFKCRKFRHSELTSIFNKRTYSSLTAWTEAALQDILEEYYTRYSSWKRCVHKRTQRTMGDLRDSCKLKTSGSNNTELYREIYRLQATIKEMNHYIERLNDGEILAKRKFETVTPKRKKVVLPKVEKIDATLKFKAQSLLLG